MASDGVATASSPATMTTAPGADFPVVPFGRVDIAGRSGGQLFVYGWILGFSNAVSRAVLYCGGVVVDLCGQAIRVPRPDVTGDFSSKVPPDDHFHGFYVLVDLPDPAMPVIQLQLSLVSHSGQTSESRWAVLPDDAPLVAPEIFNALVRQLPRREIQRLAAFAKLPVPAERHWAPDARLDTPARFEVELCCLLGQRLLIVAGVLSDPTRDIASVELTVALSTFDVLESARPTAPLKPDPALDHGREPAAGFVFAAKLAVCHGEPDVTFTIGMASRQVQFTRRVTAGASEARAQLLGFIGRMDADGVILLAEQVRPLLDDMRAEQSISALLGLLQDEAVERLSSAFQQTAPRVELHVDRGIGVGDHGLFLTGWFHADPAAGARVILYCGTAAVDMTDRWIRCARPDVTAYLRSRAISSANDNHGFLCYLPLQRPDMPCYLAVAGGPPRQLVRRARVKMAEAAAASHAVRLVLSSFNSPNDQLRMLLDDHVGAAVTGIWAARASPALVPVSQRFGPLVPQPAVSVIVPLYGRQDGARDQLALFADDSDFQSAELIYVVDDPVRYEEFRQLCPDLYGLYRVPFTVVYSGGALSFASANNCAARHARGARLLLMSSGVVPKRMGWLGDMLRVYEKLEAPGLLGVRLLNEDGSVQQAGMEFRQFPAWGDLWTHYPSVLSEETVSSSGVRDVEAVATACVLIDAGLYRELGGLCDDYLSGDFVDSDLSLRSTLAGRRNRVALDIELYHRARPSQNETGDSVLLTRLTLYDCWLHHGRWAQLIESRRP